MGILKKRKWIRQVYNKVNMGKEDNSELIGFLKSFSQEKTELVLWLRSFMWDLYPQTNELIYDNYNALAFGWSLSEKLGHTFCSIAVGRTSGNVHFGFYYGNEIPDPEKRLLGNGRQYRYILVTNKQEFPAAYMKKLVEFAYENSMKKVKNKNEIVHGKTIVKSISEAKRVIKKKK
jgi:hypothetical protein